MSTMQHSAPPQWFGTTLAAHGFDARDFELERDPEPDLSAALGLQDSLMLVRRRSTGAVRFYLGASWLTAVSCDLAAGEFGRA
ncbi:hypothetical protein V4F39_04150 [Aquincola sp. MAHUQ-54]|uniref:Uncharacterized protein n=1 Tax=Aquincola agrisoli TaxID=3119538 RepID=A0AAW9QCE1_9BURK